MIDTDLLYKLGAYLPPFLFLVTLAYLILKKINKNSVCFKCGGRHWSFERVKKEDDEKTTEYMMFRCVDCGHERSKYIIQKDKKRGR